MTPLRRVWWLMVLVVAGIAALAAPAAAANDHPETLHHCQQRFLAETLRHLPTNPDLWTIQETSIPNTWGATLFVGEYGAGMEISRHAPCWAVASVTKHEWMHQMQFAHYGYSHLPWAWFEIEADCGAWLLGATYTPYVDDALRDGGVGCTPPTIAAATALMESAGVHPARSWPQR